MKAKKNIIYNNLSLIDALQRLQKVKNKTLIIIKKNYTVFDAKLSRASKFGVISFLFIIIELSLLTVNETFQRTFSFLHYKLTNN